MNIDFEEIERVWLYISDTSVKCKPVVARARALELPITVVRLDTPAIRKYFTTHPKHAIKLVPCLGIRYADDTFDTSIVTAPRILKFFEKFYHFIHTPRAHHQDDEGEEEEVVFTPPPSQQPPPRGIIKRTVPPQPPRQQAHQTMPSRQDMLRVIHEQPDNNIIMDDGGGGGEEEYNPLTPGTMSGGIQFIEEDDGDETPAQPQLNKLKLDTNVNDNSKQRWQSISEQAKEMERLAKETQPGLNENARVNYYS